MALIPYRKAKKGKFFYLCRITQSHRIIILASGGEPAGRARSPGTSAFDEASLGKVERRTGAYPSLRAQTASFDDLPSRG